MSKDIEKIPLRLRNEFKSSDGYYARVIRHGNHDTHELYKTEGCSYEDALTIVMKNLGYSDKRKPGNRVKIKFKSQHCVFPWYNFEIVGRPHEKEFSVEFRKVIDLTSK